MGTKMFKKQICFVVFLFSIFMNYIINRLSLRFILQQSPFITKSRDLYVNELYFSNSFAGFLRVNDNSPGLRSIQKSYFNNFLSSFARVESLRSEFGQINGRVYLTSSLSFYQVVFNNFSVSDNGVICFESTGNLDVRFCCFHYTVCTAAESDLNTAGVLLKKCGSFSLSHCCFDHLSSHWFGSINIRVYSNSNNYIFINSSSFGFSGKTGYRTNDQCNGGTITCVHRYLNSSFHNNGLIFWMDICNTNPADVKYIKSNNIYGNVLCGFNQGSTDTYISNMISINDTVTNCAIYRYSVRNSYLTDSIFVYLSTPTFTIGQGTLTISKSTFQSSILIENAQTSSIVFENNPTTFSFVQVKIFECGFGDSESKCKQATCSRVSLIFGISHIFLHFLYLGI